MHNWRNHSSKSSDLAQPRKVKEISGDKKKGTPYAPCTIVHFKKYVRDELTVDEFFPVP